MFGAALRGDRDPATERGRPNIEPADEPIDESRQRSCDRRNRNDAIRRLVALDYQTHR